MNIISELEKYLLAEIAVSSGLKEESLAPDEDLLTKGVIDSLGVLKLTSFIEERFGIQVEDEDITPDNFQTLNCLRKFIELKQKK